MARRNRHRTVVRDTGQHARAILTNRRQARSGRARTLFGGRVGIFADLCEAAREESFQLMVSHARKLGANAVVGMRYDTGPMVGAAEVLCYGTAVIVEPL